MNAGKKLGLAVGFAGLLLLSGCGGGSPEESLAESTRDVAATDLQDLLTNDDGVSANFGGADVAFGGGRPDWLEPEFVLPTGIEVISAVNDPSTGDRSIRGQVDGGDVAVIAAEQDAALVAAGYEQLADSGIYVAPGRRPIEINIEDAGTAVLFSLDHKYEDEQTLRDVYAPIEGASIMVVQLGDDEFVLHGTCRMKSSSGNFTTDNPAVDATTVEDGSLTIEVRDGQQDYILATMATASADTFAAWNVLQQDDAGNFPTVSIDRQGFSLHGSMVNFDGGATAPVTMTVTCPA